MKSISILLVLLATISCSSNNPEEKAEGKDTIVIDYVNSKDTLIIDTLKKKISAKNRWTPKCEAYRSWNKS